jgi:hypothetical protein
VDADDRLRVSESQQLHDYAPKVPTGPRDAHTLVAHPVGSSVLLMIRMKHCLLVDN